MRYSCKRCTCTRSKGKRCARAALNVQPNGKEILGSAQFSLPSSKSRARKAPETQAKCHTSTWPSLQHKLWLGISDLPLHHLREDKRMKSAERDPQKAGHPMSVLWSSSSRAANQKKRPATTSTLPSRIGSNTFINFLQQQGANNVPPDKVLQLKTLARNPSKTNSCRLLPIKPKRRSVPSDSTLPRPPSFLRTAYHITHYVIK